MSSKPWGVLPISRIVTIMRSSSDVQTIGKDSSYLMAKAAEMFINFLVEETYQASSDEDGNGPKSLEYKHITDVVHSDDRYDFLRDIMPKQIKVHEWREQNQSSELSSDEDELSSPNI